MPTYTYRCTKCGTSFERVQSMSDPPAKRCPECRGKVQRTFHPVGIVLKGSGFHKTDYRSTPAKSEAGSGTSDSKADTKKDESSSTTKGTESKDSGNKAAGTGSKKTDA